MIRIPVSVSYYPAYKSVWPIADDAWIHLPIIGKSAVLTEKEDATDRDIMTVSCDFRMKKLPSYFISHIHEGVALLVTLADGTRLMAGQPDYLMVGSAVRLTPSVVTGKSGYSVSLSVRQIGGCAEL